MARLPPPPSANFLSAQWGSRAAPSQVFAFGDINELSGPARPALGSEPPQNGSVGRRTVPVDANVPKWMQKRLMRQQDKQPVGQPERQQPYQNGRAPIIPEQASYVSPAAQFPSPTHLQDSESASFDSGNETFAQTHNGINNFQPPLSQHVSPNIPPALSRPSSQTVPPALSRPSSQTTVHGSAHQQASFTLPQHTFQQPHASAFEDGTTQFQQPTYQPIFQQHSDEAFPFPEQRGEEAFVQAPRRQSLGPTASGVMYHQNAHTLQSAEQEFHNASHGKLKPQASAVPQASNAFQASASRSPYSYFDDAPPEPQHLQRTGNDHQEQSSSSSGSSFQEQSGLTASQQPYEDSGVFPELEQQSSAVNLPMSSHSSPRQSVTTVASPSVSLPMAVKPSSHSIDKYFDAPQKPSSSSTHSNALNQTVTSDPVSLQTVGVQTASVNHSNSASALPSKEQPHTLSLSSTPQISPHQSQTASETSQLHFEEQAQLDAAQSLQTQDFEAPQDLVQSQPIAAANIEPIDQAVFNLPSDQLLSDSVDFEGGFSNAAVIQSVPLSAFDDSAAANQANDSGSLPYNQPSSELFAQQHIYSFPSQNLEDHSNLSLPFAEQTSGATSQAEALLHNNQEIQDHELLHEQEQRADELEHFNNSNIQQTPLDGRRNSISSVSAPSSRRNSLGSSPIFPPPRRPSIDISLGEPLSAVPARRLSVDLAQNPVPEQQAPSRNSKWAQRAALRKAQQGNGGAAASSRPSSPPMAVSELSLPTSSITNISRPPPPPVNKPSSSSSSFLEPPSLPSPEAASPTGVAVDSFPTAAPRDTPHHRASPPLKPLPSSSLSSNVQFTLPPPRAAASSAASSSVFPALPQTAASASSLMPLSSISLPQQRRPSVSLTEAQPRRLSLSSNSSDTASSSSLPFSSLSTLSSQELKTATSTTATSKKKTGPAPLPNSFDYSLLTPDIVKERIRKRNYPVPFPIFCAMWTRFDTILVGGGGGQAGTGVKSGALICDIKKELPDIRSTRYDNGWSVLPQAEVDTCDYLVYKMAHHPFLNEIVAAVGPRIYRFLVNGRIFESSNFVQSDFSTDVANQLTLSVCFSRDGKYVVTGGEDKRIRVWSYPHLHLMKTLGTHTSGGIISVDVSADGKQIATATGDKKQPCIRVWNIEQGSDRRDEVSDDQGLVKEIRHKLGKNEMEIAVCRWGLGEMVETREKEGLKSEGGGGEKKSSSSNGGNRKREKECLLAIMNASAKGPGYIGKFDVSSSFKLSNLIKISKSPLVNMETSHDRNYVVVADNEGKIWVYDIHTLTCMNTQKDCHDLPCTSLVWSPDDSMICSASADKSVVFVPRQGQTTSSKSSCASYVLLFFHIIVVILIYLLLCPDPSRPWALTKEEL